MTTTFLKEKYAATQLPPAQRALLNDCNTIMDIVAHPALPQVLNPTFSAHYFAIIHPNNTVSSTRYTTGEWAYWDESLTNDIVRAAGSLSADIKKALLDSGASLVGKKYYINDRRIPGLTVKNINN